MNTFTAHTTDLDDTVIVRCKGRLIRSEAAFYLRHVVQPHADATSIVLDFSEMDAIGGGGLGMLVLLHRWAKGAGVRLTILNPKPSVEGAIRAFFCNARCAFDLHHENNVFNMIGLPQRKQWVSSTLAA